MIRWFEKRRKLSWLITVLIAVFIFRVSSLPSWEVGGGASILSTIYHFLVFFFLSVFFFTSMINGKKRKFFFFVAILALMSYGILDEIHQFFVPGRVCSLTDFGWDFTGMLFAFMIYTTSLVHRRL